MSNIRALRLNQGLTLIDLALLSEIPARTLAEIEYGLQRLDYESRERLARIFGVQPDLLRAGRGRGMAMPQPTPPALAVAPEWLAQRAAPALITLLVGAALLSPPNSRGQAIARLARQISAAPIPAAPTLPSPTPGALRRQPAAIVAAPPTPTLTLPTVTAQPPTPTPRFTLAADGPRGCPIAPAAGKIVMTQGYGEGSHAPANVWGAIDLGVDGDGDGYADPAATRGAPALAALSGRVQVFLGSWPGGNFVRVVDDRSGWSVAYAHLDTVAVTDEQRVEAGAPIGLVGSTGMATGPHLHYEIWHGEQNVDPTGLVGCW